MSEVHRIDFRGDQLLGVEHNGAVMIPLKPICDAIGLDWHDERRRAVGHPTIAKGTTIIVVPFGAGGPQRMVCVALKRLNFWLATVHPNRVDETIRDRLILYQEECADVLAAYFQTGQSAAGVTSTLLQGCLFPDAPVQVSPNKKPRRKNSKPSISARILEGVEYIKDTVDWLRQPILQAAYGRDAKITQEESQRTWHTKSGRPRLVDPRPIKPRENDQ